MPNHRGLSKVELLVTLVVTATVVVVLLAMMARMRAQSRAMMDSAQISGIYQAWLIAAGSYNDQLPRPGFAKRLTPAASGTPSAPTVSGPIDPTQDTTANLFSMVIMQNFFSPELCIGTIEPNPQITLDDDYDWDLYDPMRGVYWDSGFVADLTKGSNVSYAHVPLFGDRAFGPGGAWNPAIDGRHLMLGNRGPKDGKDDPTSFTYRIRKPDDQWSGYLLYSDGHSQLHITAGVGQTAITLSTGSTDDQPFAMDDGPNGLDAFIGFTRSMTPEGPVLDWD